MEIEKIKKAFKARGVTISDSQAQTILTVQKFFLNKGIKLSYSQAQTIMAVATVFGEPLDKACEDMYAIMTEKQKQLKSRRNK